jgi:hypothetical protein
MGRLALRNRKGATRGPTHLIDYVVLAAAEQTRSGRQKHAVLLLVAIMAVQHRVGRIIRRHTTESSRCASLPPTKRIDSSVHLRGQYLQ